MARAVVGIVWVHMNAELHLRRAEPNVDCLLPAGNINGVSGPSRAGVRPTTKTSRDVTTDNHRFQATLPSTGLLNSPLWRNKRVTVVRLKDD